MSLIALPLVIVNLGAEMVYILDQRLKAQCIAEDKSRLVLNDVIRTWFDDNFIAELFKPQQLYSLPATRQIFERLAHSSIMRLNQFSMEKLFDLMLMGFKYQVLCSQHAQDILQITLVHLRTVKHFLTETRVQHAVDVVEARVRSLYERLPLGQWRVIRQALCSLYQDTLVSLFMQEGIQVDGARVVLPQPVSTGPAPQVGTVTSYAADGSVHTRHLTMASTQGNPADFFQHPALLGSNLYDRDRPRATPPEGRQIGFGGQPNSLLTTSTPAEPEAPEKEAKPYTGLHELSLLAKLIKPDATRVSNFKLNLFGDAALPMAASPGKEAQVQTLTFEQPDGVSTKERALQHLALDSTDQEQLPHDAGDDLLDLLDSVAP
ncbi:MAG: hypothetical protein FRX49_02353 [Trebouxia sp. A1-2]|nr:MAG: hypothetical protein FRX49_02353 [Trebouxia sp. A1-2]